VLHSIRWLRWFSIKNGILGNKRVVDIRVAKIVKGKQFTVPAKKTKFDVIFKTADKIIIDKELNEYEINDNGNIIYKGRFELERNGEE